MIVHSIQNATPHLDAVHIIMSCEQGSSVNCQIESVTLRDVQVAIGVCLVHHHPCLIGVEIVPCDDHVEIALLEFIESDAGRTIIADEGYVNLAQE